MNVLLPWGHDDIFYDNNVYWFNLTFHSMCIDISGVPDVVVWQVKLYHEHQVEERRGVNYVQAAVLKIINYYNHDELSFSFYHRHYLRIIFRMEFSKWPQGRFENSLGSMKISSRKWKYCYFWICDCCSVMMKQKQILAQSHRQKALKTMTKSLQIKKPSFPQKWKKKITWR